MTERKIKQMKYDHVDIVLDQWRTERPDLDPSPMAVMGRLFRSNNIFSTELQKVFSAYALNTGEFDVLATLLRSGKPYTLTPNQLLQTLMLSSGAMTNRIDKLENKGLVERQNDPNDRRGVYVCLTDTGADLINEVIVQHVNKGEDLLSPLEPDEKDTLAILLKKLLSKHEVFKSELK